MTAFIGQVCASPLNCIFVNALYARKEVIFGRLPRMPLELELGLPLSNPATVSEYVQSVRGALQDIRQIAKDNLTQARAKQRQHWENKQSGRRWKSFRSEQ